MKIDNVKFKHKCYQGDTLILNVILNSNKTWNMHMQANAYANGKLVEAELMVNCKRNSKLRLN
jgi:3-hydroxymyristoyl/3-hydroxydecanoyl-(acyl carrier protein) dehydratase